MGWEAARSCGIKKQTFAEACIWRSSDGIPAGDDEPHGLYRGGADAATEKLGIASVMSQPCFFCDVMLRVDP